MRLAYITETYPPEINGVSLTVDRTVRHLRGRGHTVDLIRPDQDRAASARPSAPKNEPELLTRGWRLPMYPDVQIGWARVAVLRQRLRQHRSMLVHLATPGPLAWAALVAARSEGVPVSSDFRTNFHLYSQHYRLGWFSPLVLAGLRYFHNRTQRTFVPTRDLHARLDGDGFERVCLVGRGVDGEQFHPGKRCRHLRASWQARDDDVVLLYVGRLAAEKNVELALQAYETVRACNPRTQMVVVGDGPMRATLQARHPHARFIGMQIGGELARCYASADLFLFPSLTDTFGNVTLEALASGLPVAAFNTAAAAEYLPCSGAGVVVPVGDAQAYRSAVCSLAGDLPLLTTMRAYARASASTACWSRVLGTFEEHLMELAHAPHYASNQRARIA